MSLRLLVLAALVACAPVFAADAPPPAAAFFDNASFSAPVLSPNAKLLAVRVASKGARERLAVLDIASNKAKVVAAFEDADIGNVRWVNDERLVFDLVDASTPPGERQRGAGLFAVNRDASEFRQLVARTQVLMTSNGLVLPFYARMLGQTGRQDSDFIYIILPKYIDASNIDYVDLLRVNTLNGRTTPVKREGRVLSWMLDHDGEPRLSVARDEDVFTTRWRNPATGAWEPIAQSKMLNTDGFSALGFGPDGSLYVSAYQGADKAALYRFDLDKRQLDAQPTVAIDGYDFSGGLVTSASKLLGVSYRTESSGIHWLDKDAQAIQKAVDALLPDTVNVLSLAKRPQAPVVVVTSYSDRQPATYRLYNHALGQLSKLGESHPDIDPAKMGRQAVVRYTARDGLEIPAYVTLPPGGARKNLPLVVLVHGGPWVRGGEWGWRAGAQFLASRGYAVLEPEFRGSTGYGRKLAEGGLKQWGLAMQDDVADGARWAIKEGLADPKRICIAGASYGGYATLMGLIKDPELYQCGVAWAGVTDMGLLFTGHWSYESDASDFNRQYTLPMLLGDPVADAERFKATSPIEQAARLKQPLMLAYGTDDRRVPMYHGTRMRDAVKAGGNQNVEWIEYEKEGHGWSKPANRVDFWTRVEKFLDKHIGKP